VKKVVSKAHRRTRAALAMMDLSGRTTTKVSRLPLRQERGVEGDWYAVGRDMRAAVEKQARPVLTSGR
jgi:hypothetical protein